MKGRPRMFKETVSFSVRIPVELYRMMVSGKLAQVVSQSREAVRTQC